MERKNLHSMVIILYINLILNIGSTCTSAMESLPEEIIQTRRIYAKQMASYMDKTVDPCDDFYKYACGNYFEVNKRKRGPFDSSIFTIVDDEMNEDLHKILSKSIDNTNKTFIEKTKQFYQSCMKVNIFNYQKSDTYEKIIDYLGGWPISNKNWSDKNFDWFKVLCFLTALGVNAFIKPSNQYEYLTIKPLSKFGIYYSLKNEPQSKGYYGNKKIIMKILKMYGIPKKQSRTIFKEIVQLEEQWNKFYSKHYSNYYYVKNISNLENDRFKINWSVYVYSIFGKGVNPSMKIEFRNIKLIENLQSFFETKRMKSIAYYMFIKLLLNLHKEFFSPSYQKDFCVGIVKSYMEDAVSAIYMNSKYYSDTDKDQIYSIAKYVQGGFKDEIIRNKWFDKETKRNALIKLNKMKIDIGDVEFTLNLDEIEEEYKKYDPIIENNYYFQIIALSRMKRQDEFGKFIGYEKHTKYRPWVNAHYQLGSNQMIIPFGILRKPFFNSDLPYSYNFGTIGSIIGHEMSHGFDPNGKEFDGDGNLVNWWTSESRNEYNKRSNCFINQYNNYHIPELNANILGNVSVRDNIADNGGIRYSYFAYKKWLDDHEGHFNENDEILPELNLTNFQLFFLAYGQYHCKQYSRKSYKQQLSESHAVNKFRLIGSVSNFDEFSKKFLCRENSKMNREEKCVLW